MVVCLNEINPHTYILIYIYIYIYIWLYGRLFIGIEYNMSILGYCRIKNVVVLLKGLLKTQL